MVKRHGGTPATESAVDKALEWLARHQEADGHWDSRKYEGTQTVDPSTTGLALLAFLGAGHTEKVGKYKEVVKLAVSWIISQQDAQGSIGKKFGEPWHPGYAYHHAICGLALAEAAGMGRVLTTKDAAQKAADYSIEIHQCGDGSTKKAWRYEPKSDSGTGAFADSSVTGWFVMQIKSAKIAGLKVNPASFEGAVQFYDSIESPVEVDGYKGGQFGYTHKQPMSLNTTSIGMLASLFLGKKPGDMQGGATYLLKNLPQWDPKLGQGAVIANTYFPMYYTYYSTLTMFQMGSEFWKPWNAALKEMLLPKQRKDGDFDGSWDPIGGDDDKFAGRVYMTAMGALCLEVYYRYLPITRP